MKVAAHDAPNIPQASRPARAPAAAAALLARARSAWRRATLARAALVAGACVVLAALALLALDLLAPLPAAARAALRPLPAVLALMVLADAAGRLLRGAPPRALALRLEERIPALENRLATSLEPLGEGIVAQAFLADVEARLAHVDPRPALRPALRRPAVALLAGLLLGAAFVAAFPSTAREAWQRWIDPADAYESAWDAVRPTPLRELGASPAAPATALGELRWRIEPPAYTGLPVRTARDVNVVPVLAGSRVIVRGRFPAGWEALHALRVRGADATAAALPVRRERGEWVAEWVAAPDDRGISLEAVAAAGVVERRVVPLAVELDRPPTVALRSPDEDLILAGPRGRVPIRATADDDFGVAELRLTWIRTRGSGESFTFEEGEWAWDRLERDGTGLAGEFTLDLARFDSRPGDVVHVRAVARDRNTATGPGEGVSETRVLRIALPDELHTVTTLIGAPLELEQHPLLSQRMLILLTERLRDRAPRLARAELMHEAAEIAHDQGRLRSRVGEQIFTRSVGGVQDPASAIAFEDEGGHRHAEAGAAGHTHAGGRVSAGTPPAPRDARELLEAASEATGTGRLEELAHRHDEAPIIDVNRTLVGAYNTMWEAERALRQGEPAAALPHQYEALRLLQEAQAGERVYARGGVRVAPVDVAAARGTGKLDDAGPGPRTAAAAVPSRLPRLAELDSLRAALQSRPAAEVALGISALAARVLADAAAEPAAAALLARAAEHAARDERERALALLGEARARLAPAPAGGGALPLPAATRPAMAEYLRRLGGGS